TTSAEGLTFAARGKHRLVPALRAPFENARFRSRENRRRRGRARHEELTLHANHKIREKIFKGIDHLDNVDRVIGKDEGGGDADRLLEIETDMRGQVKRVLVAEARRVAVPR